MIFVALLGVFTLSCTAESRLSQALKPVASEFAILSVDKVSAVDLAVLNAGLRKGLRSGVRLSVFEADTIVGELMIADVSLDRSVALLIGDFQISPNARVELNISR